MANVYNQTRLDNFMDSQSQIQAQPTPIANVPSMPSMQQTRPEPIKVL